HPRVGAAAEQLAGVSLRLWGGEVIVKPPHDDGPTVWHDDLTFLPLDTRLTLNAWIALVDVPVERGPLTFLAHSHDRPGPHRCDVTAAVAHAHTYLFDQWPELRWSPRVTVPPRAGDVTFHQSRTGHRGNGNTSAETRPARCGWSRPGPGCGPPRACAARIRP
ncbi:MAG: phytanoyl-CoA dioxygenase family protein, partial [Pseudonocardia sp.]|nr:phytanoyl-CoA dioxygenase family protein [Pseudonocardia sp.]